MTCCDEDPQEDDLDEMDFPACCFCDKKYGSDYCQQCPAYDGSASPSDDEETQE
jgi:hypothetical protein